MHPETSDLIPVTVEAGQSRLKSLCCAQPFYMHHASTPGYPNWNDYTDPSPRTRFDYAMKLVDLLNPCSFRDRQLAQVWPLAVHHSAEHR
jgi:hypothetical protein